MYLTYHYTLYTPPKKNSHHFPPPKAIRKATTCQSMKLRGRFVLRPFEPGKRWVFFPKAFEKYNVLVENWSISNLRGQNPKCLEITTWNIMSTDNFVTLRASHFGLPNPTSTPSLPTPLQQLFRLAVRLHPLRQGLGAQLKNCMGSEKIHGNIFKVEEKTSKKTFLGKEKSPTISGRKKIHPSHP